MGVAIDRSQTFLGVPLIKLRNVLKAWRFGSSKTGNIARRTDVKLDPRLVAILLEEASRRGLIGEEKDEYGENRDGLTEAGVALAGASGRKRTPKAKAQKALDTFLANCQALNDDDGVPFVITQVWAYGSMIDDTKADVGDVDLIMLKEWRTDEENPTQRNIELAEKLGGESVVAAGGVLGFLAAEQYIERRLLFGGRKPAVLSFSDLDQMILLGCSCRKLFDIEMGGLVDEPVLPKHPDSPGRSNRATPPRTLPDLAPSPEPLRPIQARHLELRYCWENELATCGPWPEGDQAYEIISPECGYVRVVCQDGWPETTRPNVVTQRTDISDCDGVERCVIAILYWPDGKDEPRWSSSVKVERRITGDASDLSYEIVVHSLVTRLKRLSFVDSLSLAWMIYVLASADIERIIRLDDEAGEAPGSRSIKADVRVGSDGEDLADALAHPLSCAAEWAACRIEGRAEEKPTFFDTPGYVPEDELAVQEADRSWT